MLLVVVGVKEGGGGEREREEGEFFFKKKTISSKAPVPSESAFLLGCYFVARTKNEEQLRARQKGEKGAIKREEAKREKQKSFSPLSLRPLPPFRSLSRRRGKQKRKEEKRLTCSHGLLDAGLDPGAVGSRLCHVVRVAGGAEAEDFGVDPGAAFFCAL